MHKIHTKKLTIADFSTEHLLNWKDCNEKELYTKSSIEMLQEIIHVLNSYIDLYNSTKDKTYWWQVIQLLPSSFNQKRTVHLNYQVLKNMYHARKNHKLDEWVYFCNYIEKKLPYFKEICVDCN